MAHVDKVMDNYATMPVKDMLEEVIDTGFEIDDIEKVLVAMNVFRTEDNEKEDKYTHKKNHLLALLLRRVLHRSSSSCNSLLPSKIVAASSSLRSSFRLTYHPPS